MCIRDRARAGKTDKGVQKPDFEGTHKYNVKFVQNNTHSKWHVDLSSDVGTNHPRDKPTNKSAAAIWTVCTT